MNGTVFHIVDVFAEEKYAGNQLAVFRDAGGLSRDVMQKLAQEMGFSETTFILSNTERDGGYDVRIFTPAAEVPFAGHPTLGTASVIRREIARKPLPRVTLHLQIGPIPVAFARQPDGSDVAWMTPKEAVFGETFNPREIARLLTVNEDDIDRDFPIQTVSTGLPFVLLPLRGLDAVRRAGVHRDEWLAWVKNRPAKMLFVFCREAVQAANQLHARAFCDYYGIVEDPATGSANSCFAAYLAKHRYFGTDEINVRVEQGYEIGRPALIHLKARDRGGTIHVEVGGRVVPVAQGRLL
jgi:trans-2,3-dihydro-3-hydroxyanthranilate isomerase